jgi:hypothetical protein
VLDRWRSSVGFSDASRKGVNHDDNGMKEPKTGFSRFVPIFGTALEVLDVLKRTSLYGGAPEAFVPLNAAFLCYKGTGGWIVRFYQRFQGCAITVARRTRASF